MEVIITCGFTSLNVGGCDRVLFVQEKGLKFTLITTFALYVVGYLINVYTPIWESIPGVSFFFGFFTKHCQPQEMEFSLVLCSLRLGYYFQERVACLKG